MWLPEGKTYHEWFWDSWENDRHSPKGKGEGNYLQKQSMNDVYLWRTIQARQTYSVLCVDKIRKLEDGGTRGDINFDCSKSVNIMSQGILIKICSNWTQY